METNRKIKANKRWLMCLNQIKEYFNHNNTRNCQAIFREIGLHVSWTTFLSNNKILFKDEFGYYKWKENIPVTKKIIDKYRVWRDINYKYTLPPPAPHIIKDAKKMTVTVVPQGKEKEFIKSTKVAQPQQRRQFILILFWGLLTIKF